MEGFDWDAMKRLHEKGFISNPIGKAKSVMFTEEGEREWKRLLYELFRKRDWAILDRGFPGGWPLE